uniref:Uncharacterized protein n=1 Tax=viral metagenome TaxID=1070528 RepID=A0A6C0KNU3_9ZZZZ
MVSQIFKKQIPNLMIIKLLDDIAIKCDKCYVLNNNAFKKGIFNSVIDNFILECKPYYYSSKQKYLERKLTYNSFITIIRQICNNNKINYKSQIKYDHSNYDILYYIFI